MIKFSLPIVCHYQKTFRHGPHNTPGGTRRCGPRSGGARHGSSRGRGRRTAARRRAARRSGCSRRRRAPSARGASAGRGGPGIFHNRRSARSADAAGAAAPSRRRGPRRRAAAFQRPSRTCARRRLRPSTTPVCGSRPARGPRPGPRTKPSRSLRPPRAGGSRLKPSSGPSRRGSYSWRRGSARSAPGPVAGAGGSPGATPRGRGSCLRPGSRRAGRRRRRRSD